MSEQQPRLSLDELGDPICDLCGGRIEEPGQDCEAKEGVECAP